MGYLGLQPTSVLLDGSVGKSKLAQDVGVPILLAEATASASTTIDFDTGIDFTAYDMYRLDIFNLVPASDDSTTTMRTSTNGGSSYDAGAGDYDWGYTGLRSGANHQVTGSTAAAEMRMSENTNTVEQGNFTSESYNASTNMYVPSTAFHFKMEGSCTYDVSDTNHAGGSFVGRRESATGAVDGIRILQTTGNITSGEFKLYGLQ